MAIHILLLHFVTSHSACHSSNIYLFAQGFRSEKGMITEHKSTSVAKTSIHLIYTNTTKGISLAPKIVYNVPKEMCG